MASVKIGRIFMKSGNVIPFATKEFNFSASFEGLVSVDVDFIKYSDIGKINFVAWADVESIVTDSVIELPDE